MPTVVFGDGFDDNGSDASLPIGYYTSYDSSGKSLQTGLLGSGKALRITTETAFHQGLGSNMPTVSIHFHLKLNSFNVSGINHLVSLFDGTTNQCTLRIDGTGRLNFNRGAATLLATASTALSLSTVYHIELKVAVHNTTGTFEVKVNGNSAVGLGIPAASGQNTRSSANNYATRFAFVDVPSGFSAYSREIDNLIVSDDFIGEHRINTRLANGNGATNNWTKVGAATNWQAVLNNLPATPSDAIHVKSSNPGDRDVYDFDDETAGVTITAVIKKTRALKSDVGLGQYNDVVISGATTVVDPTPVTVGLTAAYYARIYATDPNTGAAWTPTNRNNANFGQDKT